MILVCCVSQFSHLQYKIKPLLLGGVPKEQAVSRARKQPECLASMAFATVGLGKVGYIGRRGGKEERLVLAMCELDRPTDASGNSMETFHSDHWVCTHDSSTSVSVFK